MKKKTIIKLWTTIQIILFILPIICFLIYTPYNISYDRYYVNEVRTRALNNNYSSGNSITDLTSAKIAESDIKGEFSKKVWRLQNQEVYYIDNVFNGFILGLIFQLGNVFWTMFFEFNNNDDF